MGNVNMEASQINYRGGEKKMSVEEALKSTSGEAAAIAQLQTDVLNLNSNKANQITIAPFFSAETAYDPGDLVYYNGLSYRCVNAHEGEWDADDFAATTIAGELDSLKSGLANKTDVYNGVSVQTQTFKESVTYTVQTSGFYVVKVENLVTDSSASAGFNINLGGDTESNRICDGRIDGTKQYQGIYAYLPLKAGAVIYANYSGASTTRCTLIVRQLTVS